MYLHLRRTTMTVRQTIIHIDYKRKCLVTKADTTRGFNPITARSCEPIFALM